jgi:O-antigen/teichoic acid export membrane protein
VGAYSVAQKIFSAIGMLASVINSTFFPYLSKLYAVSVKEYAKTLQRILLGIGGVFLILSVIEFFGAKFIIGLLAGKNSREDMSYAIKLLEILSFALFFSPFVAFFFQQMIIQQQQKKSVKNILLAILVNLVTAIILTYYFSGAGMAVNVIVVYIFICCLNGNAVRRKLNHPQIDAALGN